MPARAKKSAKPRRAKKSIPRRAKTNVPDMAKCSVTRTLAPVRANAIYSFDSFALTDFDRAVAIARNYQRFRMTSIRVVWKPNFDTYSPATANQKPNLYYMIDRSGAIPDNVTLEGLKQCGARPRALDERPLSVVWKPAVLGESRVNGGLPQASSYVISPLLSTHGNPTAPGVWFPSEVSHQGLKFYIEQAGGINETFQMEVEIQFEFYKPLFPALAPPGMTGKLTYAVLDASPDGVEGGSDGLTVPL